MRKKKGFPERVYVWQDSDSAEIWVASTDVAEPPTNVPVAIYELKETGRIRQTLTYEPEE